MRISALIARVGAAMAVAVLSSLAVAPGLAVASDAPVAPEKDETVYVYAAADGTVKRSEVATILKNPDGAEQLADASNLTDLAGEGDATFTGSGDALVWNAHGKNVSYTGATSAASPIGMRVSYTLDGQPIAPEQLAGKSGRVTIRYDFENRSAVQANVNGSSQTVYTPFTCITAIMLDGDGFKNVSVDNGKIVNDGDDVIVAGYAMPGLKQSLGSMADDADIPDHFTVTADASNFSLKSTMTIATAGLMSDFDADSLGIKGVDDASALTGAMGELISGSDALSGGLSVLKDSLVEVQAGTEKLYDGAGSLSENLGNLADALPALASGINAVGGGLNDASASVSAAKSEMATAVESLKQSVVDPAEYQGALSTLEALKAQDKVTEAEYAQLSKALSDGATMSGTVSAIAEKMSQGLSGLDALAAKLNEARDGAYALGAKAGEASDGAAALSEGAKQLEEGASQLNAAMPALAQGAQNAADGSKALGDGMRAFNDQGVSQLVNTLQNDYGGMLDRMNALSSAAKSYVNFGGIAPGTSGSVKFVYETDAISKD